MISCIHTLAIVFFLHSTKYQPFLKISKIDWLVSARFTLIAPIYCVKNYEKETTKVDVASSGVVGKIFWGGKAVYGALFGDFLFLAPPLHTLTLLKNKDKFE